MIKTLNVPLKEKSYDIKIGKDFLIRNDILQSFIEQSSQHFIIIDENVEKHHQKYINDIFPNGEKIILKSGEETKSFDQLKELTQNILEKGIDRKALLIAIGGGVIGDITGFAASILLRGIPYIQIPTTLLSQVDSSVGGKTAINVQAGKNLVGSFYQPRAVFIDTIFLESLPDREIKAGYAEIVKYAFIRDKDFFNWLEENGKKVISKSDEQLHYAIEKSCSHKVQIVQMDEKEKSGARALLNLGHTFGHAFEAEYQYDGRLLHGEAVAIGMVCAFEFSEKLGLCNKNEAAVAKSHLNRLGLPNSLHDLPNIKDKNTSWAQILITHMLKDKKTTNKEINMILCQEIGKSILYSSVDVEKLESFLSDHIALVHQ